MLMRALSIRQPYAWLIVRPDITGAAERLDAYLDGRIKNVENRGWATGVRGPILVHAAKTYGKREHADDFEVYHDMKGWPFPSFEAIERGGIVGVVDVRGCVSDSRSPWAIHGNQHFELANAKPLPFLPVKGMLGFFGVTVPDYYVAANLSFVKEPA